MSDTITKEQVQEILNLGGIVFPYPRLGEVRINGGRAKKATKEAIQLAQRFIIEKRARA